MQEIETTTPDTETLISPKPNLSQGIDIHYISITDTSDNQLDENDTIEFFFSLNENSDPFWMETIKITLNPNYISENKEQQIGYYNISDFEIYYVDHSYNFELGKLNHGDSVVIFFPFQNKFDLEKIDSFEIEFEGGEKRQLKLTVPVESKLGNETSYLVY